MDKYESNSFKYREEKAKQEDKKITKVVQGTVKTKKKSGFNRFMNNMVSEDVTNVKHFILTDVLFPSIKKLISETVDVILFGESRKKSSIGNKVSYRSYYDEPRSRRESPSITAYRYDDIILDNRGDAEGVLAQMDDIIDTYGMVSVADLYELVGMNVINYTDNNYGWTSVRNAQVIRDREGYWLKLPKPMPIK